MYSGGYRVPGGLHGAYHGIMPSGVVYMNTYPHGGDVRVGDRPWPRGTLRAYGSINPLRTRVQEWSPRAGNRVNITPSRWRCTRDRNVYIYISRPILLVEGNGVGYHPCSHAKSAGYTLPSDHPGHPLSPPELRGHVTIHITLR